MGHDVLMPGQADAPLVQGAAPAPVAASPARATHRPPSDRDPLLRAVLRAAGRHDAGELAGLLPDPAALRGNAAAKRALWPRLRALRRPRSGT